MKLTIDRNKWLRGEGTENSFLLREQDKKMCYVGFYCLALGLSGREIEGAKWTNSGGRVPAWLNDVTKLKDPNGTSTLCQLNDFWNMGQREERIASVFGQNGVEVEFIN